MAVKSIPAITSWKSKKAMLSGFFFSAHSLRAHKRISTTFEQTNVMQLFYSQKPICLTMCFQLFLAYIRYVFSGKPWCLSARAILLQQKSNKNNCDSPSILPLLPATAKHIACSARRHSIPPPPPGTELHANSHICIFEKPFFESEKRRDEICK